MCKLLNINQQPFVYKMPLENVEACKTKFHKQLRGGYKKTLFYYHVVEC